MTQAVILAGGLATRLGPLARQCPKSMIQVHGRPFLSYQIDFLREGGINEVVLCVGHLKEQIMDYFGDGSDYGVTIRYSSEGQPLGTAGALLNARPLLDDVFFTMYGDSYLSVDLSKTMSYFLSSDKLALMTVFRNSDLYDRSNAEVKAGMVTRYDKKDRAGMTYIDYGANIFRKGILGFIPENSFFSLEEVFPLLIQRNELLAYEVSERFYEIGSLQGLAEFTERISRTVLRGSR